MAETRKPYADSSPGAQGLRAGEGRHALSEADRALARFYRWGWLPLVGGVVAIVALMFGGWELVLQGTVGTIADPLQRWVLIARGVSSALLVAVWAGGYVFWTRKKLDKARDQLVERAQALEEQSRRFEAQLGLSALCRALTHEVRAPLHGIALHSARLRRLGQKQYEGAGGQLVDLADQIDGQVRDLDGLLAEYARYDRTAQQPFVRSAVEVAGLLAEALEELGPRAEARGVRLEVRLPAEVLAVSGDRARLRPALAILLRHAIDVSVPGSRVEIAASRRPGGVALEVAHDSDPQTDPSQLFRPFHASAGQSGLGYSIVHDVARAHGGEVKARHEPEGGLLRIELKLPAVGS